jgi:hypothetical protein
MIPKSGYRFSEKTMLKQQAKAKIPFSQNHFRFSTRRDGIARMRPTRLVADPERAQDIV